MLYKLHIIVKTIRQFSFVINSIFVTGSESLVECKDQLHIKCDKIILVYFFPILDKHHDKPDLWFKSNCLLNNITKNLIVTGSKSLI